VKGGLEASAGRGIGGLRESLRHSSLEPGRSTSRDSYAYSETDMKVELRDLATITPYQNNPRINDPAVDRHTNPRIEPAEQQRHRPPCLRPHFEF